MKNILVTPSNDVARRLVTLGCPLDTATVQDDGYSTIRRRLVITQQDGVLENRIFDLDYSGTGFMISLAIGYGAYCKLTISDWDLDLPGFNSPILLADDPLNLERGGNVYRIPGAIYEEYEREVVINHRRVLKTGDLISGFLFGYSFESMPDLYSHGIEIEATLTLLDQENRRFPTHICLWADRKSRRPRRRSGKVPRRRIFDSPDKHAVGVKHG